MHGAHLDTSNAPSSNTASNQPSSTGLQRLPASGAFGVRSRLGIARRIRAVIASLLVFALLVTLSSSAPAHRASAAGSVAMPFLGGKAVRIIQGYSGGTHQGRSRFGLDLTLADGGTSGAEVVSPVDGTVTYAQSPNAGNGCMGITLQGGSHSVLLCHVIYSRSFKNGESIARGQALGTVGAAGTVGNNGAPHVHLELHRGGGISNPVPFDEPDGLLLEGMALPASSTTARLSKHEPIVSSNRSGGGSGSGAVASSSEPRKERRQLMSDESEPAPLAAAGVPEAARSIQPSSTTVAASRIAVVRGTESCLKVRKQPSAEAPVVGCLREGTEVSLRPLTSNADPRWRQTDQGWIAGEYLKRTQAVVSGTDGCLNVREAPKAGAERIGCLPDGTAVTIAEGPTTADGSTWYRIEQAGSLKKGGWVAGQYLD